MWDTYEGGKYRLTRVFQYFKTFYDSPDFIKFKNTVFMTPGPIEDFLFYRYGKNWKTPINTYETKSKAKETNRDSWERGVRRKGR